MLHCLGVEDTSIIREIQKDSLEKVSLYWPFAFYFQANILLTNTQGGYIMNIYLHAYIEINKTLHIIRRVNSNG